MWFETLFSYPIDAFETGTLVFGNVEDPIVWIAGSAIVFIVIAFSVIAGNRTRDLFLWQRGLIGILQAGVALGVIGLLSDPMLQTSKLQPGRNTVALLLDTSGSMDFTNGPGESSRAAVAIELVQGQLEQALSGIADLALFTFDSSTDRTDSFELRPGTSGVDGTKLIRSVDSVLAGFNGLPLAGIVVLSDGADNDDTNRSVSELAVYGVPVHTIGFGPLSLSGEVQLANIQLPLDVPPDSLVSAGLTVKHSSSGKAILRVRDGNRLLAIQELNLVAGSPIVRTQISFDSGSTGIRELSFELEPPAGDSFTLNNNIQQILTVNERRRRVLYLEGEPRWEYKFIRRAIKSDEVIEIVSWLRTTDNKTFRQGVRNPDELGDGFPASLEELYSYDVIMLGSLAATSLTDLQHTWLESFVAQRGGSLLALAGRQALADGGWDVTPLAAALPVSLNREQSPTYRAIQGRVRPTRDGLMSPLTRFDVVADGTNGGTGEGVNAWVNLPPLGDHQLLGELKPAATVLLEFVQDDSVSPLLVTQPYGLGTVAVLATATTWRWQMRTPPEDPRHGLFWRQLLRHLAMSAQREKNVEINVENEGIVIRAWMKDEKFEPIDSSSVHAIITQPDRKAVRLRLITTDEPGVLEAQFVPELPGVHRVDVHITQDTDASLAGKETEKDNDPEIITRFFRTGLDNREYFDPIQNESLLRRIAQATGGRYWRPEEAAGITTELTFNGTGVRTMKFLPLWNMPVFFLLLLLVKMGEWALRRSWGKI